jgi:hypothetical protein
VSLIHSSASSERPRSSPPRRVPPHSTPGDVSLAMNTISAFVCESTGRTSLCRAMLIGPLASQRLDLMTPEQRPDPLPVPANGARVRRHDVLGLIHVRPCRLSQIQGLCALQVLERTRNIVSRLTVVHQRCTRNEGG